ncbi:conserved hypothetical protein [Histoplasma capsulatum var. duboisii H88]|uniref:Uncharacterized protein n=1 Tax=Ajellomyces capsulatus (strain H88) TaxID=544711 RepID=F0U652_AJEC8|nr:conserved hypothetical protein [Histoplasma capsulatum var. duboisii H88]
MSTSSGMVMVPVWHLGMKIKASVQHEHELNIDTTSICLLTKGQFGLKPEEGNRNAISVPQGQTPHSSFLGIGRYLSKARRRLYVDNANGRMNRKRAELPQELAIDNHVRRFE